MIVTRIAFLTTKHVHKHKIIFTMDIDVCLSEEHKRLVISHFQDVNEKIKKLEREADQVEIPQNIPGEYLKSSNYSATLI